MIKMTLKEILKKLAAANTDSEVGETAAIAIYNKSFIVDKFISKWSELRRNNNAMSQSINRNMQQGYGQQMGYQGGLRGYQDPRQMAQNSYMSANAAYQNQSYGQPYGVPQGEQQQQNREPLSKILQRVRESQAY